MKPFARQLKQMIWTIPVCLTILSPLAAQALTVEKGTLDATSTVVASHTASSEVASKATSFESKSKVYKSSGEGLLALLVLLGVPTVVIFIIANSNSSSSSRRSSSRRSSSSSYTGGIYTGGDYSGGDSGGGYSGGSDCGGGSFGGGDSGGGGAGGDF
ncbi:MAG: hypothetical protein RID09_27315 [Coleofasciculus sp. G1-WW12-02]|uniref:hypothetical protein n=2 Tax=unclassified Coleofasciculus TaxID=2692782 RepID=UPI0032FFB480